MLGTRIRRGYSLATTALSALAFLVAILAGGCNDDDSGSSASDASRTPPVSDASDASQTFDAWLGPDGSDDRSTQPDREETEAGSPCQAPLVPCGNACVDTNSDIANCGSCGRLCAQGQVCSNAGCAIPCPPGLTACSGDSGAAGSCVDTQVDIRNCGSCGNACPSGQVCSRGACALSCQQGLIICGGTCVDPASSRQYCGATGTCAGEGAGTVCGAGQVCSSGVCQLSCQSGLINCGSTCIDPRSSLLFCGASGLCTGPNAGTACSAGRVCSNGVCSLSCQAGLVDCGGACVDPTNSREHCGATGTCTGPNVGTACSIGQVCSNGVCQLSCQNGLVNCSSTCIDPRSNLLHCGASGNCMNTSAGTACAPGQVCSNGVCSLSCQVGLVNCEQTCIDPLDSRRFCGASGDCALTRAGTACTAGQVCAGGACRLSCQAGLVNCGGRCLDPLTDRAHCGASNLCLEGQGGVACPTGQVCASGACALSCQQGLVNCGGTCIDPTNNRQFCGATDDCIANRGSTCLSGEVCSSGSCQLSCQGGQIQCNGTCIDPASNRQHCGASGNCTDSNAGTSCATGQVCSNGACQLSCQTGLVNCGGTCIDPVTSRSFCGASGSCVDPNDGQACVDGQVCLSGSCSLSCQQGLVNCGNSCIDPATSRAFCGASGDCQGTLAGQSCGAGTVCTGAACSLSCQSQLVNCSGICVDPETDRAHCGAIGDCAGGNAGQVCAAGEVCSAGACSLSCSTGLVKCGVTCVDPATDRSHCGATGDCAGLNAGQSCAAGRVCAGSTCTLSCQVGLVNCGGTCIDPASSRQFCGAAGNCTGANAGTACPMGQTCSGGTCQLICSGGTTACGIECVNTQTNRDHCGSCSIACGGATPLCVAGSCVVARSVGGTLSGLVGSVSLTNNGTDPLTLVANGPYVFSLGHPTGATYSVAVTAQPGTQICTVTNATGIVGSGNVTNVNVSCCNTGLTDCSGVCVDQQRDGTNCGGCGITCTGGRICSTTCQCPAGQSVCGATCANLTADSSNCGTCGNACAIGQICIAGGCSSGSCPSGSTLCGGSCVMTGNDAANCGMCGNACTPSQVCAGGVCTSVASIPPVGCADGTREAFASQTTFPNIAACAGGWTLAGVFPAPSHSVAAGCEATGNSSASNVVGTGCASVDLCAAGWHICRGGEIQARAAGGCTAAQAEFTAGSFFVGAISSTGCNACALTSGTVTSGCTSGNCASGCVEHPTLNNDVYGCGTGGGAVGAGTCDANRAGGNNCALLGAGWICGGDVSESITLTRNPAAPSAPLGGVLCCR